MSLEAESPEVYQTEVYQTEISQTEISQDETSQEPIDLPTLGTQLQLIETALMEVRSRYEQVCTDEGRREELQAQREALVRQNLSKQALKAELDQLDRELVVLEERLESKIFAWNGLRKYFWQTVRFVGLGMAIGWGLAFVVQQQPLPEGRDPAAQIEGAQ
jgi:hypothetical protein